MATIASQIDRIQRATNLLREVITEKWAISNITTTRLDDIAARYNEIPVITGDVPVQIHIETDGKTTVAASGPITNGYYKGVSIKPFIKVDNVNDIIVNVENKTVNLKTDSGRITPTTVLTADGKIDIDKSYNYLQSVSYTIKHATMPTGVTSLGDGFVTINIPASDAGWVSAKEYTITGATAWVKMDGSTITRSPYNLTLKPTDSRQITIDPGIRKTAMTINIPAATSALDGDAKAEDIVVGKTAWTASGRVTGNVPDKRNTTTGAANVWADATTGKLIIKPAPGCYNDDSLISTDITVGEATYTLTGNETVTTFEIKPSDDEDGSGETYLNKVTIDNSIIYTALSKI